METSKTGGLPPSVSVSASTASPSQKPVTLSAPRMLSTSEIESLRQHKQAVARYMQAKLGFAQAAAAGN